MSVNQDAFSKLKQACDQAYDMHPHSCSHAVWQVIQQYLPTQPWMSANALMAHVQGQNQWKPAPVSEIGRLAREGALVIGGKTETGNGHVIVVYPGPDKPAGGYAHIKDGKQESLRTRGNYAPAMSTSLGSWPGAMSKGDKTVWDPWANDTKFSQVTFWKLEIQGQQVLGGGGAVRVRIATLALKMEGRTDWGFSKQTGNQLPFTNKCNLFVAEVTNAAGAVVPSPNGGPLGARPITASVWANKAAAIAGWRVLGAGEPALPGDIAAIEQPGHDTYTGHVAIVVAPGKAASATSSVVVVNDWGFRKGQAPTFRRWEGSGH